MVDGLKTLLLVEDDAVVSKLETQLLKKEGYNIIHVGSGELAVSLVRTHSEKIDLILMDIDLGEGIDGTAAAGMILKDYDIPVVFLSSHTEKEIVEKTEKITSYGYVVKNTGITVLDASIKMAFKLFEAQRNIRLQNVAIESFNENLQAANLELEAANRELVKSEMMLREKDELLHLTSRIARVGGWEFDADLSRGTWTDEVARIYDLEPESPTGVELSLSYFSGESKERLSRAMKDAVDSGMPYDLELELTTWSGNRKWVRTIGLPVKLDERVVKVHGTFQDITGRKLAEIEVARLNRLYEVTSQINQLIVHERNRERLLANTCRITVETGKIQMAWIGFIDQEKQEVVPVAWSGIEEGYLTRIKKISVQDIPEGQGPTGRAIRAGRVFCCNDIENEPCMSLWRDEALKRGYRSSIALPLLINGEVAGSFNIYAREPYFFTESEIRLLEEVTSDIAYAFEMIEADEKRKRAEEQYRLIAENSSDTIWVLRPDGTLTYHSPAVFKLRGYTPEEANRIPLSETLTADSLALVSRMIEEDSNRPVPMRINEYRLELEMIRKDKTTVWTDVSVHVLRDAEGSVAGFQGSTRDITERKRAEEELRALAAQRETLIKELQHRVRNNLNVISGLLALESEKFTDENVTSVFRSAIARIQTMRMIYERLYLSDDLTTVELHRYIKDLAESVFSLISRDNSGIKLVTELDEVKIDLKRTVTMGLVLNELLTNSLKYACFAGSSGKIVVNLVNDGDRIKLCVKDEGPGLSEVYKSGNNRRGGLNLVRMITDQMGADINIENNGGAAVSVTFPL